MHVRDHAHGAVGAGQLLARLLEVVVARVRDLVDTDCGRRGRQCGAAKANQRPGSDGRSKSPIYRHAYRKHSSLK